MKNYKLKKSEIKYYNQNGYLILKNIISKKEILDIRKEIFTLSRDLYIKYNKLDDLNISFSQKNFDKYLLEANRRKMKKVTMATYDVCKKIFTYISIFSSNKMRKICKILMNTNRVGILNRGFGVRIDYPLDKYFKARLHQDYTSQIGSTNGLVLYLPLRNIKNEHGPVVLYKKSHKNGVRDTIVNMNLVKNKQTYDPYYVDISKKQLNKFAKKKLIINEGDVVFFNFCLLHESGFNRSNEIRWSLIARFMDFENKESLKMDFMGGQHEGNIFMFKNKNAIKVKS